MCLPLVVIVGLGWRLARDERNMARQRLREFLLVRLQDTARVLEDYFQEQRRRLHLLLETVDLQPGSIRHLVRRDPRITQVFVVHADGSLLHPDPQGQLNMAERRFLDEFGDLFLPGDLLPATAAGNEGAAAPDSGWVVRFQGPGLHLLYCRRLPSGQIAGVLLPRARWMADLIADLPETTDAPTSDQAASGSGCIRLVDSHGQAVYEWGGLEPNDRATPLQEWAPAYPLSSWRLQYFVDDPAFAAIGRGAYYNLLSILAATGLVLLIGGGWFYREYNRQVRDALQRVSFVNQVSHELKTPLTNIRMYAELLEHDLEETWDDQPDGPRGYLKVIVDESHRLSRLIGNVLTFAQKQRGQIALRRRPAVVDDVIATVLQRFEPALRRRGLEVDFKGSAVSLVEVDGDILEQIVGNLLNNVEKYASSGKGVEVATTQEGGYTSIVVADDGPGIPLRYRERIFRPFERLSHHISDAPGAGIGLTIARQLARLHGGDLVLTASARGARFELRLPTPSREREGGP